MRRRVLLTALASVLLAAPSFAQTKPNVVLIVMDDVGYGDYGATARRTSRRRTSIASQRRREVHRLLRRASCTPTRAALITGRYYQRTGLENPLGAAPAAGRGLVANGRSLPQLMKNEGYATGLIGKWHLGYRPDQLPKAHGFDYFFGFLSGLVDYYQHTDQNGKPDLFENDKPVTVDGYMTDLITDRAIRFID